MKEKKQEVIKAKKSGFLNRFFVKPAAATRKIIGLAPQAKSFVKLQKDSLDNWSEVAREKLKNPARTNFELGQKFYREHYYQDAVMRFKIASFMNKNYPEAYLALGKAYLALNKLPKAATAFTQARSLNFDSPEQNYFFQIYCEKNPHLPVPKNLVKEYFTMMAQLLDEEHFSIFSYIGDQKVKDLLSIHYTGSSEAEILDLGCGTGVLGKEVKALFPNSIISGLDFLQEMLEIAKNQYITVAKPEQSQEIIDLSAPEAELSKQLRVYDFLIRSDIETYQDNKKYDVIMARGILDYVLDLDLVIGKLSEKLKPNGLLVFFQRRGITSKNFTAILENYSFPFFSLSGSFVEVQNICQKYDLHLIEKSDFDLENLLKATAFIYRK